MPLDKQHGEGVDFIEAVEDADQVARMPLSDDAEEVPDGGLEEIA